MDKLFETGPSVGGELGLKKEIVKLLIPSHEQQLESHRNNILNI